MLNFATTFNSRLKIDSELVSNEKCVPSNSLSSVVSVNESEMGLAVRWGHWSVDTMQRDYREGWPLLTVETEVNVDS
jgi:hypothetical protein